MTFPHRTIHLIVTAEDEITCVDNRDRALLVKGENDVYLQMVLTLAQTAKIKEAVKTARDNKRKRSRQR